MTELKSFFEKEKIEYFSVLDYRLCRAVREDIMKRESFMPKSVIVFLLPYYSEETVNISRYAASRDYHAYIREVTDRLAAFIKEGFKDSHSKGYGDHSPIDERHAALISGLGILGENRLLINEKYGSYVFIAELITDIEPELLGAKAPFDLKYCDRCGACLDACPTKRGESGICLSALTQKKGELTEAEAQYIKIGGMAWGCDACQTVCPYNKDPIPSPIPYFHRDIITELTEETLASMPDPEFSSRAFAWRGKKLLERNLKILKK